MSSIIFKKHHPLRLMLLGPPTPAMTIANTIFSRICYEASTFFCSVFTWWRLLIGTVVVFIKQYGCESFTASAYQFWQAGDV
jgi:hypothetical protein